MNRHRSRKFIGAVVAAFATFALTACGTSFSAQTNQQYQPGVGANLRTGDVQVYNALFVDNEDGTATFSGALLNRGDTPEELTSVTVTAADVNAIEVEPSTPVSLVPDQLLTLGSAGEIIVEDPAITHGVYVTVVFTTDSGQVTIEVPVVERTSMYDDVATQGAATPADAETAETTPESDAEEGAEEGADEPATEEEAAAEDAAADDA